MGLTQFNEAALRKMAQPRTNGLPAMVDRRRMFKLLGLGMLAINPLSALAKRATSAPFRVKTSNHSVTFIADSYHFWEIDKKAFDGDPQLFLTKTGHDYLVKLSNALFPGSLLPADFEASIRLVDGIYRIDLSFDDLGIAGQCEFEEWLGGMPLVLGTTPSPIDLKGACEQTDLVIHKGASVSMLTNWQLKAVGEHKIEWAFGSFRSFANNLTLIPIAERLSQCPHIKRGLHAEIHAKSGIDNLLSAIILSDHDSLSVPTDASGTVNMVNGWDKQEPVSLKWIGNATHPLVFKRPEAGQDFLFTNYILALESKKQHEHDFRLLASASDQSAWYTHPAGSFKFGGTTKSPSWLDVWGRNNQSSGLTLETNLVSSAFLVEGALSLPVSYLQDPQRVRMSTHTPAKDTATSPQDPKSAIQRQPITNRMEIVRQDIVFRPNKAIKIKVLRPEDLLYLEFEFHNMRFAAQGKASFLEIDDTKKPGLMVVRFQTQHTLEEAFWEDGDIKPKEADNVGSPNKIELPARYLKAGKSRLVYEIEPTFTGIPLLLEELLNWSRFKLRINHRAHVPLPTVPALAVQPTLTTPVGCIDKRSDLLGKGPQAAALTVFASGKYRNATDYLYQEKNAERVVPPSPMMTLRPAFDLKAIAKVMLKPEPIPDDQTAIEAPALLYISPNQLADFAHTKELSLRNTKEAVKEQNDQLIVNQRVFDPLFTNDGNVAELWHTTLGIKLSDGSITRKNLGKLNSIRALWAFDAKPEHTDADKVGRDKPFRASLDAHDRHMIVHQTSNYSVTGYKASPAQVNQLMLTSLGCYLDLHGLFYAPGQPVNTVLNLLEWEHKATLGRDHYVKVVYAGYLFPFGHQAAVVKVTERKFDPATKAAINRQRMYVVVTEPEKTYRRNDPNNAFIPFPFIGVNIKTLVTPSLNAPVNIDGNSAIYNFVIKAGGKPFMFDLQLFDKEGQEHVVSAPLIFIEPSIARDANKLGKVIDYYNGVQTMQTGAAGGLGALKTTTFTMINRLNVVDFKNREVNYAENLVKGDSAIETSSISFGAQLYPSPVADDIKFHPMVQHANVWLKPVVEITGNQTTTRFYLEDDNNKGQVFGRIDEIPLDFSGGADKSGGFLCPNASLTAVSKFLGPVGGTIDDAKNLMFNPGGFFKEMPKLSKAKIFGVIDIVELLASGLDMNAIFQPLIKKMADLSGVIDNLNDQAKVLQAAKAAGEAAADAQLANVYSQLESKANELKNTLSGNIPGIPQLKTYQTQTDFVAEYKWKPKFDKPTKSLFGGLLRFIVADINNTLIVTSTMTKPKDLATLPSLRTEAVLQNFDIEVAMLIRVKFDKIQFLADTDSGAQVNVVMKPKDPVVFVGPLSFVNKLQTLIPSSGFGGDKSRSKRDSAGISLGYEIEIPSIEVGVFSICNITLGAKLTLPLNGDPLTMQFNFCKRENPFLLTVSVYGGGGYLQLVTYLSGLKSIEGAFEFGGAFSLNVGVASGSVKIMGGIYFAVVFESDTTKASVAGYLRINGNLSILGLINVALEFYLELLAEYDMGKEKLQRLRGTATLKVKVEVLFFSKTVSVTVSRELKGADADPKFSQTYEVEDWEAYALAFA